MNDFCSNEVVKGIFDKINRKIERLNLDFDDDDIYDEIENAFEEINNRRHFIPTSSVLIEDKYVNLAYKLCINNIVKEGAEGEKSHSENGINRSYDNSELLSRIVPLAKLK